MPPSVPSPCAVLVQEAEDAAVLQKVCHAVSNLLDRVHRCLDVRDFSTHQLPVILSGLLRFASARELLQCLVLPILAQCLVQFPATTLLSKVGTVCSDLLSVSPLLLPSQVVLKSWAVKGMFAKNMQLSQVWWFNLLAGEVVYYNCTSPRSAVACWCCFTGCLNSGASCCLRSL